MSEHLRAGAPAAVAVSVATLWRAPDRIRSVDATTTATPPDLRRWVTMTAEEQVDLLGRIESQLLLGDRVLVEDIRDGWAQVIVPGQASARDPRGYPGWIAAAHLAPAAPTAEPEPTPTHIVDALTTDLRDQPDGSIVVPDVTLGTSLAQAGSPTRGWLPVALIGRATPVWVPVADVAPRTETLEPADALRQAERLLGVRYIWGGLSPFGTDCSGLVHLAYRRIGVTLPRDAQDQADATTPLAFGTERPGDLYFFAHPDGRVFHVGVVTASPDVDGTRHMLHASGRNKVVAETVTGDRLATLAGVHRATF